MPLDLVVTPDDIRALIHNTNWYHDINLLPVAQPFINAGFRVVRVEHIPEHNIWLIRLCVRDGTPWPDERALQRQIRAIVRDARIATGEPANVYRVRRPYFTCVFMDAAGPPPFDPAWLEGVADD